MDREDSDALRNRLEKLLQDGFETQWRERAYTGEEIDRLVTQLRSVPRDEYAVKLVLAGFTDHPYVIEEDDIVQACETCMYYLIHRQFCELPALQIPVKPQWSCRLWRV